MKGYRFAIQWLVDNDDNEWIRNGEDALSVSASLVADLYCKTDDQVRKDLQRALKKSDQDR